MQEYFPAGVSAMTGRGWNGKSIISGRRLRRPGWEGEMEFDYYYGMEAEQFSFYRIPRTLVKDKRFKGLSSDA